MALHGADLEAMTQLARRLDSASSQLNQINSQASLAINSMTNLWRGADAADAQRKWFTTHRPRLTAAVTALADASATVERNRQAQQATSSVLAGSGLAAGTSNGRRGGSQPQAGGSGTDLDNGFHFGDTGRPDIRHDNGFLQNPDDPNDPEPIPLRDPTDEERDYYNSELRKAQGADYLSELPFVGRIDDRLDLEHGIEAYRHFLTGDGEPREFDYETFLSDDQNGQITLDNSVGDARAAADEGYQQLLANGQAQPGEPVTFTITSDPYAVGGPSQKFPYPHTEDWQKAIGAHHMWTVTEVTYSPGPDGEMLAEATVTLHAEDRYNFNPGQADIATGEPDSARGVLEESGLATQYDQTGTASYTTTWAEGEASEPTINHEDASR